MADQAALRFIPNRLERWRADNYWECAAEDITGMRLRGKMWLVVDTSAGAETFRVFGAAAALPRLQEALAMART